MWFGLYACIYAQYLPLTMFIVLLGCNKYVKYKFKKIQIYTKREKFT